METLLTLNFWFNMRPGAIGVGAFRTIFVFVVILVVLTLAFYFLKKQNKFGFYKRTLNRLNNLCLANTIIGLFITFFVYEQLPFLSMRIWLLLWLLGILVWLGFIVNSMLKIPKLKKNQAKEKNYQKYIP